MNDFRHALRMLWKSPAFSIIAIATVALGIGANTAIFSVIESALLRPLPFPKADRLVRIYETFEENSARGDLLNLSEKTVRQWREYGRDIFEGIGVATGASVSERANAGEPAHNFSAARISSNFLTVLDFSPVESPHGQQCALFTISGLMFPPQINSFGLVRPSFSPLPSQSLLGFPRVARHASTR